MMQINIDKIDLGQSARGSGNRFDDSAGRSADLRRPPAYGGLLAPQATLKFEAGVIAVLAGITDERQ